MALDTKTAPGAFHLIAKPTRAGCNHSHGDRTLRAVGTGA
jgi:hypothetical protein